MILKELLSLSNLTGAETVWIPKSMQIVIVDRDKELIFVTFQIVVTSLECFNNGQKLIVVSFVPSLYKNPRSGKKTIVCH